MGELHSDSDKEQYGVFVALAHPGADETADFSLQAQTIMQNTTHKHLFVAQNVQMQCIVDMICNAGALP